MIDESLAVVADELVLERRGGVAILTLNRPAAINAINMCLRHGLVQHLSELDRDESVSAIVIHGAGERGFCAGADIKEARPAVTAVGERDRLMPCSWIETVSQVRKPVIAAIHGVCMGAGLELALACDIRIAAKGSRFALPEIKLGLIPGGGGTQRLPRLIGVGRAMDMILTGEEISGDAAMNIGLISRIYEDKQAALDGAIAVAEKLGRYLDTALSYAREVVAASADLPLQAGLNLEKSLFSILAESRVNANKSKSEST